MEILQNITNRNREIKSKRSIKYIVIHYTANDGDTAYDNTVYFKSVYRGASAHYFIDENKIYQCVFNKDIAWHCGTTGKYFHNNCRNSNSIGIEMCSRKDRQGNYYIKQEVIDKTIKLTKYLMNKYNIPKENVLRHFDVTHKICPAPFVYNQDLWYNFLNKLDNGDDIMVYNKIDELPEWSKNEIKYFIDNGYLNGINGKLSLSEDMVRLLVILYRVLHKGG